MNWRETHHGYYGLAILALAIWGLVAVPAWPWRLLYAPLALVGAWLLGDDVYQHVRELRQASYRSSLHRWFYRQPFARWPIVRRLNAWLDHLFGKAPADS